VQVDQTEAKGEAVPEDDPKGVAEHALATLLRLKGTEGQPTLQEIGTVVYAIAEKALGPERADAWFAICRVGESLEKTGVASSFLWDDAINRTTEWRKRLG
jgi:hypothetical protein